MIKKEDVFKIGQFAKPHGVKGEIALITDYDLFDDSEDDYVVVKNMAYLPQNLNIYHKDR